MKNLRAVLYGAGAVLLRLSREGLVIRAMAWPGLLSVGVTVLTVLLVTRGGTRPSEAPHLALDATDAGSLSEAVARAGLELRLDADPRTALALGRARRAAWKEGDHWVLAAEAEDVDTLRAEAVLREASSARTGTWRLEVPADPPRRTAVETQSGRIGALVSVLFALYGVVMGAGLGWRDRGEGVVEATLPLPVPAWTHGAARILALGLCMSLGLVATLLLLHGMFGLPAPGRAMVQGSIATSTAAALGLATVGGSGAGRRGFSGPLSRAMAMVAGLLGLGFGLPVLGAWLPIASLASLGSVPIGLADLVAVGLGLAGMVLASWYWGRGQGGLGS